MKWTGVKSLSLLFVLLLASVSTVLLNGGIAKAVSDYDSIIDGYSEPKGLDDDYYVQATQLDIADFTAREVADYLRGNDELLGGYSVIRDTGNSSTCDSSDWINAGNRITVGSFMSNSQDYYDGTSRVISGVTFSTVHDPTTATMTFSSTLHAFNNRGVYKGGFVNFGDQDMARITLFKNGSSIGMYCWNGNANQAYQWQGSNVPQGASFAVGYLYDNWYPNDTASWNIYFLNYLPANTTITYPSGYEGDGIPDFPPISENPNNPNRLRPNITVEVADKKVSITSKKNDLVYGEIPDYKIYWFISNATFDGEGSSCEPAFSTSGYSLPDMPLVFDAPCYGQYSFNAYFSYNNGEYPIDEFSGNQIGETTINVNINGATFVIDTDDDFECDNNNFCTPPSTEWEDEPCDLFNLGGCVNNILHYIAVALGIEKTSANPTGSPFVSFNNNTNGLTAIISAPIVAVQSLTSRTCSPIVLPIPFVNRDITLPCYYQIYQNNLGSLFTLYQTVITGVISYYVIVGILNTVKDIKNPKKDQIEVLHL